jgi:hypothetical protein
MKEATGRDRFLRGAEGSNLNRPRSLPGGVEGSNLYWPRSLPERSRREHLNRPRSLPERSRRERDYTLRENRLAFRQNLL